MKYLKADHQQTVSTHTNASTSTRSRFSPGRRLPASASILLIAIAVLPQIFSVKVAAQSVSGAPRISTIAGGGYSTSVETQFAPMLQPVAVAMDPQGRGFYVIDEVNSISLLRFVNTTSQPVTLAGVVIPAGRINLLAGGGLAVEDGASPLNSDLAQVTGMAVSPSGNVIYLAIPTLGAIRAINVGTENVTLLNKTVAPGKITTIHSPSFFDYRALAVNQTTGDIFYIAEQKVRRVDQTGNDSVYAGGGTGQSNGDGGPATQAKLNIPIALAYSGNNLLIVEAGDTRGNPGAVRKVDAGGTISSLVTGLAYPNGITVRPDGNILVSVGNAQHIVQVTPTGTMTVVAGDSNICNRDSNPTCGDGGAATSASLNLPGSTDSVAYQIAADSNGLFIPDYRYARVRYANLSGASVSITGRVINAQQINSVVGSGQDIPFDKVPANATELNNPAAVVSDAQGNLFISDTNNSRIRFVNRTPNPVTLFQGTVSALTVQPGEIMTINRDLNELRTDDRIATAGFAMPQGMAITSKGLYIVDSQNGTKYPSGITGRRAGVIRFLNTSNANVTIFPNAGAASIVVEPGNVKTIAGVPLGTQPPPGIGDGDLASKAIFFPTDIALDDNGNIYIADQGNNLIRHIDAQTGIITSVQAKQSNGSVASLTTGSAIGIALDGSGRLLIADTLNDRVLRQNAAGGNEFSIIADSSLGLSRPRDLVVDSLERIFVASAATQRIIQLQAANDSIGTARVVAGTGTAGFSGDGGAGDQAQVNLPNPDFAGNAIQIMTGLGLLPNGDLLVTDGANNRIRLLEVKPLAATSVSAANFSGGTIASESIVAVFGNPLATSVADATTVPLPTSLAGTTVRVRDSVGTERLAPLFFVSQFQVNYQMPPETAAGTATITITSGAGAVSVSTVQIETVKPGMFTADSSGQGLAAALALRVKSDNSLVFEPVSRFDTAQNKFVAVPIDFGPATDNMFLVLFGTGIRFRSAQSNVVVRVGGTTVETLYAGAQGGFVGLDQINVPLPRSLAGRGDVDIEITVDGKVANTVKVNIK